MVQISSNRNLAVHICTANQGFICAYLGKNNRYRHTPGKYSCFPVVNFIQTYPAFACSRVRPYRNILALGKKILSLGVFWIKTALSCSLLKRPGWVFLGIRLGQAILNFIVHTFEVSEGNIHEGCL